MANSFCVLLARAALPARADLAKALAKAKLPLGLPDDFAWTDSGWSPMRWRDGDSGCELELDKAARKDVAAAKRAGLAGVDCALTITTRGWESLQAGAAFAAAVAGVAGGCIDEDTGVLVAGADAMRWAKRAIAAADKALAGEREAESARAAALAGGDVETRFAQALAAMAGAPVRQFLAMMGRLGFILADGRRLSAAAWRLQARDGRWFDQTRYSALRSEQIALLMAPADAAQKKRLAALEKQLHAAGRLDEQANTAAMAELEAWPEGLAIESATWAPPGALTVRFAGGTAIEFVPTRMNAVELPLPPLTFVLDGSGVALR